ncbi:MAG: ribonuclease P protein component [Candidatus Cloacimonetes bacterium]|nr:ribonuclease P protein component [Candidatus Cloacimonadota bacterium]
MTRWIHRHSEFQEFIRADQVIRSQFFTIPVLPSSEPEFAFGITIGKRIGKAVVRNLLRRRIKAWFRQTTLSLAPRIRIILIARREAGSLSWQQLDAELSDVIGRIRQKTHNSTDHAAHP